MSRHLLSVERIVNFLTPFLSMDGVLEIEALCASTRSICRSSGVWPDQACRVLRLLQLAPALLDRNATARVKAMVFSLSGVAVLRRPLALEAPEEALHLVQAVTTIEERLLPLGQVPARLRKIRVLQHCRVNSARVYMVRLKFAANGAQNGAPPQPAPLLALGPAIQDTLCIGLQPHPLPGGRLLLHLVWDGITVMAHIQLSDECAAERLQLDLVAASPEMTLEFREVEVKRGKPFEQRPTMCRSSPNGRGVGAVLAAGVIVVALVRALE